MTFLSIYVTAVTVRNAARTRGRYRRFMAVADRVLRGALGVAATILTACAAPGPARAPSSAAAPEPSGRVVASGELALPAAGAFGEPGFHDVLTFTAAVPPGTSGRTLVLRLRDASRPERSCASEHPLSGCATVDWSDDPGRPKVPASGVFENTLMVRAGAQSATLHLRANGRLAAAPEPFDPG